MSQILLVEDMPDSLTAFVLALRMAGHTVTGETSPHRAIERYREQNDQGTPFDLVILDLAMPGMNGFEAAAHIRAFDANAHIAFLTAFDEPLSVGRAESSGALAFWSKPITAPALVESVAQVLRSDFQPQMNADSRR